MTSLMAVLVIICATTLLIAAIMIWKVFDDCDKRMQRRQRMKEARSGRQPNTFGASTPS